MAGSSEINHFIFGVHAGIILKFLTAKIGTFLPGVSIPDVNSKVESKVKSKIESKVKSEVIYFEEPGD